MRAPSYKGLREDKPPREVVREDRRRRPADDDQRRRSATPEALFDEVERLPGRRAGGRSPTAGG